MASKLKTESGNWDNFWRMNRDSRFTKISWSKRRIIGILDPFAKSGLNVLDAGSGSGFFSNYFISKNCNVYSLDYSEDALDITRRVTLGRSKEYIKADLLDERFGERYLNTFDVIFTDGLFEHFSAFEQKKIMDNFRRVKKDDGTVFTFVPNRFSFWTVVRPFFMPGIHEVPFTRKKLLELHQGMKIVGDGGLNVLPVPLSPDRLLGPLLGMIVYVVAV
ncbi:MAG: class I SAM-dependent methyltransferase [Oligoflexales bacterium]|nr:class I SAM-dependent methyltransferase [Oligoflexales bacterium]